MKVPELLFHTAKTYPGNVAIFDEEGSMTYMELHDAVKQVAARLQQAGIKKGMGVGVLGKNSRQFIIMAFSVMQAGAVVMPLSNQFRGDELKEAIHTAGLHALIDDEDKTPHPFPAANSEIEVAGKKWRLRLNPAEDLAFPFAAHVEDPALIRFTSGTTGTSKGVILSHATIEKRIAAANTALQLGPGDNVLWVLSMAYHFVVSIILYLRYGCSIIICNEFMAGSLLEKINTYNATFIYASPMHIRLLSNDASGVQMKRVSKVISTSTGISKDQCDAFRKRFNIPVSQAYGIIEVGLPVINFEKQVDAPDAIGYAVPGYEVEILDDDFNMLPPGQTGHLAMRGPGMLDAYLSPPRKQEEILQQGWFMTGDLASKSRDGLIRVEGRKKSMINVAGNKVFPEEVEAVLNRHPLIALSRVSGYRHPLLGESVQAEVVLNDDKVNPGTEILRGYCREHLSPHKVPQKFVFVHSLPMTDSGKLMR